MMDYLEGREMLNMQQPLRSTVRSKFSQARASKDLLFSETQLALLQSKTLQTRIQLRYCPALKSKPKQDAGSQEQGNQKKFDPFENPSSKLLIAQVQAHNLVLNKYPVIENHFIAATVMNKPQSALLEEDDLHLTYKCLYAWPRDKDSGSAQDLFAFFNSGEHSGASQPHRHLQFLPVEDMAKGSSDGWSLLCETMRHPFQANSLLLHNPVLPFVHFATSLEANMNSHTIHDKYLLLMKAALASISEGVDNPDLDAISLGTDKRTTLSYNLSITTDRMAILPRKAEAATIPSTSDGHIFVNGTILAGTIMVRSEDDWDRLRDEPELMQQIFQEITYPVRPARL